MIPVGKDKRPLIKWEPHQKVKADKLMIDAWYKKWPEANIGIVCGDISGVTVIDADSENAINLLNEYLPETFQTPIAKTPKGMHYYFDFTPEFSNAVRLISDIDIRNTGGYVVAPPSKNGDGNQYEWLLKPTDAKPEKIPAMLLDILSQSPTHTSNKNRHISSSMRQNESNIEITQSNKSNIFQKGRRDDDLFRLANALIKSGMPESEVSNYLIFIAQCCNPPFDENEARVKVGSALKRDNRRSAITTQEVRNFIKVTSGNIKVTDIYQMVTKVTPAEKMKIRVILGRLVKEGLIERVGKWDGTYRKVEDTSRKIDLMNLESREVNIDFPLGEHDLIVPQPKNIYVVAGERDSGKSCYCLNFARLNLNRGTAVRYFTSEMGGSELKTRLVKFESEVPFDHWLACDFRECAANYQDAIDPNGINIIDYLKLEDNFWQIGGEIKRIFDKLENGVCLIALQKKTGAQYAVGGQFTLDEARLYVTLSSNPPDGGIAKIEKAKNWRREDFNPNYCECNFTIQRGARMQKIGEWFNPYKNKKKEK